MIDGSVKKLRSCCVVVAVSCSEKRVEVNDCASRFILVLETAFNLFTLKYSLRCIST
jgi:hypothetical protein